MIGRFVDANRGPALFEDLNPDGSERSAQPIIKGDIALYDIPLVVLVNGGTASASEIVSGALRDYDRATIVGEQTFGKGSVQRVHDFQDGSSARITFAEWLTPQQHRIQGEGITPDVVVTMDGATADVDPQLERAVQVLTGATSSGTPVASPVAGKVT
jgi:carboxyl-terminal processing protease